MTVLIFLAVLFVLVLVHEWGHFIAAKKTGMRVDEFGIGFPPKVYGVKKGETEYTFNALPIGGFVKIYGEDAESAAESGDFERSFIAKPKWAQAIVLIAGVMMNIVFAWFLFTIAFAVGVPTPVDEATAGENASLVVTEILPGGPAAEVGIPLGATITGLSAGETAIETLSPSAFVEFTQNHTDAALDISYTLGDESDTVTVTPATNVIAGDADRPAVGVALALVEKVRQPLHIAAYEAAINTYYGLINITVGLSTLLADSVTGQADFSQVAGPIGIATLVGDAAEFGFTSLLMFTAFISLNLAIINMLPFPALDGGRLLFVAIETVTRRPINPVWVMRLNTVGFVLLILLMVVITYSDVRKIL